LQKKEKKNFSSNSSPYFKPMLELGFHNPNQTTFGAESGLDFLANKKKTKNLSSSACPKKRIRT
jgi:hypothetical protein